MEIVEREVVEEDGEEEEEVIELEAGGGPGGGPVPPDLILSRLSSAALVAFVKASMIASQAGSTVCTYSTSFMTPCFITPLSFSILKSPFFNSLSKSSHAVCILAILVTRVFVN